MGAMRAQKPIYFTDWLVTIVRWLLLLSLALASGWGHTLSLPMIWVLLIAALCNITLAILNTLNRRMTSLPIISVLLDYCTAMLIFYLSGGLSGNLFWAGLLPLISASLYFGWRGTLSITLANTLGLSVLALNNASLNAVMAMIVIIIPVFALIGLIFSELHHRMLQRVTSSQKAQESAREAAERTETSRRHAIFSMISNLSASLNYERVLDMALDVSLSALATFDAQADQTVCAILLFSESEKNGTLLKIGSSRRLPPSDQRITLPGRRGLLGRTIDAGTPQTDQNLAGDIELNRFIGLSTCQSAYCIPVRDGRDTYGVLLYAHPDPAYFTLERRDVLETVGNQINIAIQNSHLYRDLELEKERMLSIQEEARIKIARDLHDGPTQSVSAIAMRVNFARRLLERDPKATAEELFKIEELARRTTKEIRHMLFTLRPLVLESQGLVSALNSMAEKMQDTYNQNVVIEADPDLVENLEMSRQTVAFYIAEEAVNNARKHAKADHIWVRLKPVQGDLALLEIADDGVGFDLRAVDDNYESRGSLGLVNMRERADLVNGVIHIESCPGQGTRIQVAIPLTEQAADRIRQGK